MTGKFKKSFQSAKGTLKVTGNVGGLSKCTSGQVNWKAG